VLHEKGKKKTPFELCKAGARYDFSASAISSRFSTTNQPTFKNHDSSFRIFKLPFDGKKKFRQMADQRENHMFLREINFMHMQCSCATTRLHSTGSCQQQQR